MQERCGESVKVVAKDAGYAMMMPHINMNIFVLTTFRHLSTSVPPQKPQHTFQKQTNEFSERRLKAYLFFSTYR